jgi:hypothetical protein
MQDMKSLPLLLILMRSRCRSVSAQANKLTARAPMLLADDMNNIEAPVLAACMAMDSLINRLWRTQPSPP